MALVTFEQAKRHLRVDDDDHDTEIEEIRVRASLILLDYLKKDEDYWQDSALEPLDVPGSISAATLLICGALFENHEGSEKDAEPLSKSVLDLVHRHRDPALA
jgi:hypothetical protein